MNLIKFVLSVILTILAAFFMIASSGGIDLFVFLIFFIISLPFYFLYKSKNRKQKIITGIISLILIFVILYFTTGTVNVFGMSTSLITYQYSKTVFDWENLLLILYFVSLFVNVFIVFNQFVTEQNDKKIDILTNIVFILNIIIYLNVFFNPKLPDFENYINTYHNINYVSQFYGIFTIIFIILILYNKINSQD